MGRRITLSELLKVLCDDPYYGNHEFVSEIIQEFSQSGDRHRKPMSQSEPQSDLLHQWYRRKKGLRVYKSGTDERIECQHDEVAKFVCGDDLEIRLSDFKKFLRDSSLPFPGDLFPDALNNTHKWMRYWDAIDNPEYREAFWITSTEIQVIREDLDKARRHREALEPEDRDYLRRKRDIGDEIQNLTICLGDAEKKLEQLGEAGTRPESTEERDKRLQRRFNELYRETGNKMKACVRLNEEEKSPGGSKISWQRLMTIMRVAR